MQITQDAIKLCNEAIQCVRLMNSHVKKASKPTTTPIAVDVINTINKFRYYCYANVNQVTPSDDRLPFKHDQATHDEFMVVSRNLNDIHYAMTPGNQKKYKKAYDCVADLVETVFKHLASQGVKG